MKDFLIDQLLFRPSRMRGIGQVLLHIAFVLLVAAILARLATLCASIGRPLWVMAPAVNGIAEVYPGWPTWWVPEGWLGLSTMLLIAMTGVTLCLKARQLERLLNL